VSFAIIYGSVPAESISTRDWLAEGEARNSILTVALSVKKLEEI